jgi:hypothetical protein
MVRLLGAPGMLPPPCCSGVLVATYPVRGSDTLFPTTYPAALLCEGPPYVYG